MSRAAALRTRLNAAQVDEIDDAADVADAPAPVVAVEATDAHLVSVTGLKTASPFQIGIFRHVHEQVQARLTGSADLTNLAVEAVAGSGKTTTIVAAANLFPTDWRCIFLAFNKAIATELDARLPKHVSARTLNGLGMFLTGKYLKTIGVEKVDVRASRTFSIMRDLYDFKKLDLVKSDVNFLVGMCKSMGIVPVGCTDGEGIDGMEATDEVLTSICLHHGRMIDPQVRNTIYASAREVLAVSWSDSNVYKTNCIDFDDQKWFAVCKRVNGKALAFPMFDAAIIDEVQDVNKVDISLVNMVTKSGALVIGVGDSNQAIYGFRGADTGAFGEFVKSFSATVKPLSITYRCGSALVEYAQKLVPTIEAASGAVEGQVEFLSEYDPTIFQPGDMVMCRNNTPLVEFAYKMIAARVPVYVKGRKIGEKLAELIEKIAGEKTWVPNPRKPGKKMPKWTVENVTTTRLVELLNDWADQQVDLIRLEDPDNEGAVQAIRDQQECIMVFVSENTDGRAQSVVGDIASLFSDDDDSNKVCCATIHKAKGLEADRTFMYQPECLYPWWVEGGWQLDQERNLDYVARTRGKTYYGLLRKDGWK